MKTREEIVWEALVAASAPAFTAGSAPPYGFVTRVLAAVRAEQRQAAAWDLTGRRAIWASLAAVLLLAVVTVVRWLPDDVDPPVRNLAPVADVTVS